jgi:hypothetical protein
MRYANHTPSFDTADVPMVFHATMSASAIGRAAGAGVDWPRTTDRP